MKFLLTSFALLILAHTSAWAQDFSSSYTLFSTGTDATYSGTISASGALPAGIEAVGFFDHFKGDRSYTEATLSGDVPGVSGLVGVYELQDTVSWDTSHLVGVGYRHAVGPFSVAGKFFPYSTEVATDFAAEVSAETDWGNWSFAGFVDITRDGVVDDTRWFSKMQAVRSVMPHVDFVGEYRWSHDYTHTDRTVWFGVNFGL